MTLFGHLGLATLPIKKLFPELRFVYIALGTLAPDLLDKTLFYSLFYSLPPDHPIFQWIAGTRTIGHSGIAAIILLLMALWNRRESWAAFTLGWVSHLMLDFYDQNIVHLANRTMTVTLLFPFGAEDLRALKTPHSDLPAHLAYHFTRWKTLVPEVLGLCLLVSAFYRRQREDLHAED